MFVKPIICFFMLISTCVSKSVHITEQGYDKDYHIFSAVTSSSGPDLIFDDGVQFNVENVLFVNTTIGTIPTNFDQAFPYVENLNMSKCEIQILKDDGAFGKVPKLQMIDLSRNKIKQLKKNTFKGLKHLKYLLLNENQIGTIARDAFMDLENLKVLHLNKNQLKKFGSEYLKPLQNLEEIILNENKLEFLPNNTFQYNEKLRRISLYDCSIHQLGSGIFMGLKNLRILSVAANPINEIYLPSLMYLQAFDTNLTTLKVNGRITHLVADNNNLKSVSIDDVEYASVIVLSNNMIEDSGNLSKARNLIKLDVSDNNIGTNISSLVWNMTNLRFLNVSNTQFPGEFESNIFANLTNLRGIDLSNNGMKVLDPGLFQTMKHLNFMLLHGNNLSTFDFQRIKDSGVNIRICSLHSNRWDCTFYPVMLEFLHENYIEIYMEKEFYSEFHQRCNVSLSDDDMLS